MEHNDQFHSMPYRILGNSGLKVSNIGLGTWKFGYPDSGDASRVDPKEAFAIFDRALELGVTFWDTANRYNFGTGNSERVIGEWFAANPRERRNIVLATKMGGEMDGKTPNHAGLSRANILDSVYASLERLQTDYIDLLYFHNSGDPRTPQEESLEAIEDLVRQDLIRYFAVSNYTVDYLDSLMRCSQSLSRRCRPIAVQNQFDILSGERAPYEGVWNYCREHGLSFVAWSPLAGGLLTGRYRSAQAAHQGDRLFDEGALDSIPPELFDKVQQLDTIAARYGVSLPQLTLAYLLAQPGSGPVIPASSSVRQLESNAAAGTLALDCAAMSAVASVLNASDNAVQDKLSF